MTYRIALLPGDGIGPEVLRETRTLLDDLVRLRGLQFEYDEIPCGGRYYLEHGRDWPIDADERVARADLILLGAVGWPSPTGGGPISFPDGRMAGWSAVVGTRTRLDLFANVRPVRLLAGVRHRVHGDSVPVWQVGKVDLVIVRENTEGLYAGIGGRLTKAERTALAVDTRIVTREASERVIRFAFELCKKRNRGAPEDGKLRVTSVAKENVLRGCQLFSELFDEIGREYPEIVKEHVIVDAFTQSLVSQPEHYDVCVTTNMFGDIVTDLASVLQGGMGMAVGCNLGERHAMFEPIHGSAPSLAGKNVANPMATILAAAAGLRWLGERNSDTALAEAADAVEAAVARVLVVGAPLTADLVGEGAGAPMSVVASAIREKLAAELLGAVSVPRRAALKPARDGRGQAQDQGQNQDQNQGQAKGQGQNEGEGADLGLGQGGKRQVPEGVEAWRRLRRLATAGKLASSVSHEINNPLSCILGNLEYLAAELPALVSELRELRERRELRADSGHAGAAVSGQAAATSGAAPDTVLADALACVDDSIQSALRIRSLSRQLAACAGIAQGKAGPLQLDGVVESALQLAEGKLKRCARVTKILGNPPTVVGEEGLLYQILVELLFVCELSGAVPDPERHRILVSTRSEDRQASIEIVHVGELLSEASLSALQAVAAAGAAPNACLDPRCPLGLAIGAAALAENGGSLCAEPTPDGGTRFVVRLPLYVPENED